MFFMNLAAGSGGRLGRLDRAAGSRGRLAYSNAITNVWIGISFK